MNKTLKNNYEKLYPNIDVSKGYFTFDDLCCIIQKKFDDINFDASIIQDMIHSMDRKIRSSQKIVREFAELLNPGGQPRGSKRSIEYWLRRGWNENYAVKQISHLQSIISPRCVSYWVTKGFSEDEALQKVSKVQSEYAKKMHMKIKENKGTLSIWSIKYWLNRGFTLSESVEIISEIQKNNSKKFYKKYSKEERRVFNPMYIEYWKKRHGEEDYIKMYEDYLNVRYANKMYRSIIADQFCSELATQFVGCRLHYSDTEFGKYIPGVGYRKYDFVDLDNMTCVEFHGNYWHTESEENDDIKRKFIESLGFRYFVVWESDYKIDPTGVIEKLTRSIKNENCKISN